MYLWTYEIKNEKNKKKYESYRKEIKPILKL